MAEHETELAACPFCGSSILAVDPDFWVVCKECLADGPCKSDRTADPIAAWNTRAPALESGIAAEMRQALETATDAVERMTGHLAKLCAALGKAEEARPDLDFIREATAGFRALLRKAESKGD